MNILMDLSDWMTELDLRLLLAVNHCNNELLDWLMWMLSDKMIWIPLYLALVFVMFRRLGTAKGVFCLITIILLIAATDQTCASVIRPVVARLRPSSPDNPISSLIRTVNGYRGGNYGFPSCHAANTFALASFLSLVFRNRLMVCGLLLWSVLVSLSRIYLGVHYPSDILAGFFIGAMYSVILKWLYTFLIRRTLS